MESNSANEAPTIRDTRPFITRDRVADNPEAYKELVKAPAQCPVCMCDMIDMGGCANSANSPLLGEVASRCTHFACWKCWQEIWIRDQRSAKCPICRTNVYRWLLNSYDRPAVTSLEFGRFILEALFHMQGREGCEELSQQGWSIIQRMRPPP